MSDAAVVPVLRAVDAAQSARWYARLGFEVEFEHRFEPGFPLYLGLVSTHGRIHLSEHAGDAPPEGLVLVYVESQENLASSAEALGVPVTSQPWGLEAEGVDPDGNRLRIIEPVSPETPDPPGGS